MKPEPVFEVLSIERENYDGLTEEMILVEARQCWLRINEKLEWILVHSNDRGEPVEQKGNMTFDEWFDLGFSVRAADVHEYICVHVIEPKDALLLAFRKPTNPIVV